MDKSYKRTENIDEKIKEIKLAYNVWRTLFLVDENTSVAQIADILEETPETVMADLQILEEAGLVSATEAEDESVVEEEPVGSQVPEPEPEPEPEPTEEEDEEATQVEEEPVDQNMPEPELVDEEMLKVEEEPPADAPKTEVILEEKALPEEEPLVEESEETGPTEPQEEEAPAEEESAAEAEEEMEINIAGEDSSEAEMLDVDFGEEIIEPEKESGEEVAVEAPVPELEQEPEIEESGKKSILVIDDSIVIRKMVEIALESEEYQIHTAVSGKDGLAKIDQLNPSLIILDLMLPDINGIDILKTVKASRKTPVIMLSGKDSPQMVEKAKEAGADAFLPKPFKDDELIEKINALI